MKDSGLPSNVINLVLSSCTDSTWKQYTVYIKKWFSFCSDNSVKTSSPSINDVLIFLTKLYNDGIGYSGINTARSALSFLIGSVDGMPIGKHPLVIRLVKGVWKSRTPKPRYNSVWDAGLVLGLFKSWPTNSQLDLKRLSMKLVALLALISAQRVQTLCSIKLCNIKGTSVKEIFVNKLLKTSDPNRKQPCLFLPSYNLNDKICIVATLDEYIRRTADLRSSDDLFVSFSAPYKPVSSQTLSRWLKFILEAAKIDTSVFKGHSFRHASTSKAASRGVDMNVIFSCAGWSDNSKVFAKYYNKPIDCRNSFSNALLE